MKRLVRKAAAWLSVLMLILPAVLIGGGPAYALGETEWLAGKLPTGGHSWTNPANITDVSTATFATATSCANTAICSYTTVYDLGDTRDLQTFGYYTTNDLWTITSINGSNTAASGPWTELQGARTITGNSTLNKFTLTSPGSYRYVQIIIRFHNQTGSAVALPIHAWRLYSPGVPPATPAGLAAGATTQTSITMSWTGVSGATGYRLYRDAVEVVDQVGVSFDDTGLAADTSYSYTVSSYNVDGESAQSAAVVASTLISPPAAPTDLTVTGGDGSASLTWSAGIGGGNPSEYRVYRDGLLVQTVVAATTWEDTGLTNGVLYSYTVSAYNIEGESAETAPATVTPAVPPAPPAMAFTIDLSGLGASVVNTLDSLGPIFLIAAGLALAAGVLTWGLDLIQRWRQEE